MDPTLPRQWCLTPDLVVTDGERAVFFKTHPNLACPSARCHRSHSRRFRTRHRIQWNALGCSAQKKMPTHAAVQRSMTLCSTARSASRTRWMRAVEWTSATAKQHSFRLTAVPRRRPSIQTTAIPVRNCRTRSGSLVSIVVVRRDAIPSHPGSPASTYPTSLAVR